MDRRVPWLVFGLVVALVVAVGSIGLALLLPGVAAGSGPGAPVDRDRAGWPFSWDTETVVGARSLLAPLWSLLLIAVPLALTGLVIAGLVWATRPGPPAAVLPSSCRGCGHTIEPGWGFCPICGEPTENVDDQ
jgi:hypothetical protein